MTKNVPMKRIYALKTTKTDNISRVTLFILGIAASKVQFGVVRNKESSIKFTYYHVCIYVYIDIQQKCILYKNSNYEQSVLWVIN